MGWLEEDDEDSVGHETAQGFEVFFGGAAVAEAGDGDALGFGQQADDAPGMELVAVVHKGISRHTNL